MIAAAEALRLPSAQLSDSDASAVNALLAEIEAHIRANMQRRGVAMPIPFGKLNPAIMAEVGRVCRKSGWLVAWQEHVERSVLTQKPEVLGFVLALEPSAKAYEEIDSVEQKS